MAKVTRLLPKALSLRRRVDEKLAQGAPLRSAKPTRQDAGAGSSVSAAFTTMHKNSAPRRLCVASACLENKPGYDFDL